MHVYRSTAHDVTRYFNTQIKYRDYIGFNWFVLIMYIHMCVTCLSVNCRVCVGVLVILLLEQEILVKQQIVIKSAWYPWLTSSITSTFYHNQVYMMPTITLHFRTKTIGHICCDERLQSLLHFIIIKCTWYSQLPYIIGQKPIISAAKNIFNHFYILS